MISKKGLTSLYQDAFEFQCYHCMPPVYIMVPLKQTTDVDDVTHYEM